MHSEWKVTSNTINGQKVYGVYRLRDTGQVDHSGNREYAGDYVDNRETAAIVAKELNKIDKDAILCKAKVTSYMDDGSGGDDLAFKWITKDKYYDLNKRAGDLYYFIDDMGDTHYIKNFDKYFIRIKEETNETN